MSTSRDEEAAVRLTRRTLVRDGIALSTAALVPRVLLDRLAFAEPPAERPWLAVARQADMWLARSAQRGSKGLRWPADPSDPNSVGIDLYHGNAGVVLFYLELFHASGDSKALDTAVAGADELLAAIPDEPGTRPMGLYTGLSGVAVTLSLVHRATQLPRFLEGARRALDVIGRAARTEGRGVAWNASTDIISGSAGIGLFLVRAAAAGWDDGRREMAFAAGRRLIELAEPMNDGLRWLIQPGMARNYPNFSHGTAGVAYYLATLHQAGGERSFLDAALAGVTYLESLMTSTPNDGRMVWHSTPGNEQIFYLSWCHGPAGTARLYERLRQITGDPRHATRVRQLAQATMDMGVPARSPGFWNNVSQCCGNGGVMEFFTDLYRSAREARYLELAERMAHDTLRRGTTEGDGIRWVQAEHRVRPELLVAQTGLMQGAAGVGLAMLHLDGAMERRAPFVVLPDNPF